MNDADMLPFHLFYFEGDMAAFPATVRQPRGSYILGSSMISILFIFIKTEDSGQYCIDGRKK